MDSSDPRSSTTQLPQLRMVLMNNTEIIIRRDIDNCFIIAEIGQNHQGDLTIAKELILRAKEVGANSVKFQASTLFEKYTQSALDKPYTSEHSWGRTYGEHKKHLEFTFEELLHLRDYASSLDIAFGITVMDSVTLKRWAAQNVAFIKIGSGDAGNFRLIEEAAQTWVPLIISTGMQDIEVIKQIYRIVSKYHYNFALLHCVSAYPPLIHEINLRVISSYLDMFGDIIVGYSSHDRGSAACIAAYTLGARIIEKHFTRSTALKGSDHSISMNPSQLFRLITDIRNIEWALGTTHKRLQYCEIPCLEKHGKTLVATTNLPVGHVLTDANIVAKVAWPRGDFQDNCISILCNKLLTSSVMADEPFKYEHFE